MFSRKGLEGCNMKYFHSLIKFSFRKQLTFLLGAFQSHGRGWDFMQFFFREKAEFGKGEETSLQHHTVPRLRLRTKLSYLF